MAGSGTAHLRHSPDVVLRVQNLVKTFKTVTGETLSAVADVSFDVLRGETVGLVGESGCGKSTTARAILRLEDPTSGSINFDGHDLGSLSRSEMRQIRPRLQMIFQDPMSSLNPRLRVRDIVAEPLRIWGLGSSEEQLQKVRSSLETVGLDPDSSLDMRPHQFSGGQCQRISIARALVLEPEVLVCDEPVSALDVSVQAQILNLLEDMKDDHGLTMVFISHDLAVVKNVSDRVAVMYLGKLCELTDPVTLYERPLHPYTEALLASVPSIDPALRSAPGAGIGGELPSPVNPPSGCRFRTRCSRAQEICSTDEPEMTALAPDHYVACHFPLAV